MVLGALCQEPRTKSKYISYYTTKFAPLDPFYALLWASLCLEMLMSLDCIVQTPLASVGFDPSEGTIRD